MPVALVSALLASALVSVSRSHDRPLQPDPEKLVFEEVFGHRPYCAYCESLGEDRKDTTESFAFELDRFTFENWSNSEFFVYYDVSAREALENLHIILNVNGTNLNVRDINSECKRHPKPWTLTQLVWDSADLSGHKCPTRPGGYTVKVQRPHRRFSHYFGGYTNPQDFAGRFTLSINYGQSSFQVTAPVCVGFVNTRCWLRSKQREWKSLDTGHSRNLIPATRLSDDPYDFMSKEYIALSSDGTSYKDSTSASDESISESVEEGNYDDDYYSSEDNYDYLSINDSWSNDNGSCWSTSIADNQDQYNSTNETTTTTTQVQWVCDSLSSVMEQCDKSDSDWCVIEMGDYNETHPYIMDENIQIGLGSFKFVSFRHGNFLMNSSNTKMMMNNNNHGYAGFSLNLTYVFFVHCHIVTNDSPMVFVFDAHVKFHDCHIRSMDSNIVSITDDRNDNDDNDDDDDDNTQGSQFGSFTLDHSTLVSLTDVAIARAKNCRYCGVYIQQSKVMLTHLNVTEFKHRPKKSSPKTNIHAHHHSKSPLKQEGYYNNENVEQAAHLGMKSGIDLATHDIYDSLTPSMIYVETSSEFRVIIENSSINHSILLHSARCSKVKATLNNSDFEGVALWHVVSAQEDSHYDSIFRFCALNSHISVSEASKSEILSEITIYLFQSLIRLNHSDFAHMREISKMNAIILQSLFDMKPTSLFHLMVHEISLLMHKVEFYFRLHRVQTQHRNLLAFTGYSVMVNEVSIIECHFRYTDAYQEWLQVNPPLPIGVSLFGSWDQVYFVGKSRVSSNLVPQIEFVNNRFDVASYILCYSQRFRGLNLRIEGNELNFITQPVMIIETISDSSIHIRNNIYNHIRTRNSAFLYAFGAVLDLLAIAPSVISGDRIYNMDKMAYLRINSLTHSLLNVTNVTFSQVSRSDLFIRFSFVSFFTFVSISDIHFEYLTDVRWLISVDQMNSIGVMVYIRDVTIFHLSNNPRISDITLLNKWMKKKLNGSSWINRNEKNDGYDFDFDFDRDSIPRQSTLTMNYLINFGRTEMNSNFKLKGLVVYNISGAGVVFCEACSLNMTDSVIDLVTNLPGFTSVISGVSSRIDLDDQPWLNLRNVSVSNVGRINKDDDDSDDDDYDDENNMQYFQGLLDIFDTQETAVYGKNLLFLHIKGCRFRNVRMYSSGSAIKATGTGWVRVYDNSFDDCASFSGSGGSVSLTWNSEVYVSGNNFTNSEAPNGFGGALLIDCLGPQSDNSSACRTVHILNNRFHNCTADRGQWLAFMHSVWPLPQGMLHDLNDNDDDLPKDALISFPLTSKINTTFDIAHICPGSGCDKVSLTSISKGVFGEEYQSFVYISSDGVPYSFRMIAVVYGLSEGTLYDYNNDPNEQVMHVLNQTIHKQTENRSDFFSGDGTGYLSIARGLDRGRVVIQWVCSGDEDVSRAYYRGESQQQWCAVAGTSICSLNQTYGNNDDDGRTSSHWNQFEEEYNRSSHSSSSYYYTVYAADTLILNISKCEKGYRSVSLDGGGGGMNSNNNNNNNNYFKCERARYKTTGNFSLLSWGIELMIGLPLLLMTTLIITMVAWTKICDGLINRFQPLPVSISPLFSFGSNVFGTITSLNLCQALFAVYAYSRLQKMGEYQTWFFAGLCYAILLFGYFIINLYVISKLSYFLKRECPNNQYAKAWLSRWWRTSVFLTAFTMSAQNTVRLCNCHWANLPIFCMGLTQSELRRINLRLTNARIFGLFAWSLPQIALECFILYLQLSKDPKHTDIHTVLPPLCASVMNLLVELIISTNRSRKLDGSVTYSNSFLFRVSVHENLARLKLKRQRVSLVPLFDQFLKNDGARSVELGFVDAHPKYRSALTIYGAYRWELHRKDNDDMDDMDDDSDGHLRFGVWKVSDMSLLDHEIDDYMQVRHHGTPVRQQSLKKNPLEYRHLEEPLMGDVNHNSINDENDDLPLSQAFPSSDRCDDLAQQVFDACFDYDRSEVELMWVSGEFIDPQSACYLESSAPRFSQSRRELVISEQFRKKATDASSAGID